VPAKQRLPLHQNKSHEGMLAGQILPIKDLHGVGALHAPWTRYTLDPVLEGPGDAQLEQQTMKLRKNSW
jgi:hypothetical protein